MLRLPTLFAAAALASLPLVAAAPAAAQAQAPMRAPGSPNPATVQAGTYKVETTHARVGFVVNHMGFSNWRGDFSGVTGTLTLDPQRPTATQLEVTVPVNSVTTTNATLDGELKGADWLDAVAHPTASFKATQVTPAGAGKAKVTGDFTLHGVTKPLTLDVSFVGGGVNPMSKAVTVGFDATGKFKRSDFGVSRYVPVVGDEVTLVMSVEFVKQ